MKRNTVKRKGVKKTKAKVIHVFLNIVYVVEKIINGIKIENIIIIRF